MIYCERRATNTSERELTTAADMALDGDGRTVEGLGSAYGVPYEVWRADGSKFVETMQYGVFSESLKTTRPISQYQHGRDSLVGSAPILALEVVREQPSGLYFRGKLLDGVPPLIVSGLRAGEINSASVRFSPTVQEWSTDRSRVTVKKGTLAEVGVVIHPANPAALVKLRQARQDGDELTDREKRIWDLYTRRVMSWAEVPRDVVAAWHRKMPRRVELVRGMERDGKLGDLAAILNHKPMRRV